MLTTLGFFLLIAGLYAGDYSDRRAEPSGPGARILAIGLCVAGSAILGTVASPEVTAFIKAVALK